ncbi:hypothetical protein ACNAWD_02340 [Rhodococcus erythropolis]|uniref:hypothetical protein n=1 Tax=Rhodococcus erythropolis TaxID=1833 RepID=UPI003A4DA010
MRTAHVIHKSASAPRMVGVSALLVIAALTGCSSPASDTSNGDSVTPPGVTVGTPPPPGITDDRAEDISTLPPVPVDHPSPLANGLEVTAVTTEPLELTANGPGEIAGSGLSATLDFVNKSTTDISLDSLTVNAYYGDRLPAAPGATDTATPVSGLLPPGDHQQGVYVFQVPEDGIDTAVFEVGHSDSQNVIAVAR